MAKKLVAVIDIGSLTARIKIFEVNAKGKPKEIEAVRKFTGLGSRSYRSGTIQPEQVDELCRCLKMFDEKCREYGVTRVFCVATSAFRDATNADIVIEKIRTRTGFKIKVLDNAMERYYQTIAVQAIYPDFGKMIENGTMILDIGSGSLQASVYDKSEFVFSQNLVLGSLRISGMLSDLQSRTTHYEDVLEEFIAQDLNDYHAVEPKGITYRNLIAFSGEMGFIKKLSGHDSMGSCELTKEEFLKVYEYLLKTRPSDLTAKDKVPSMIAPLLLPTALIVKNILEYTGVDFIYMPHASLSDGIVYHYCYTTLGLKAPFAPDSYLISAARHIAKRYRSDKKHVEFVEKTALKMFDELRDVSGLGERDRLLLQVAVILHEIGKFVHARNHSDAAYSVIKYTNLMGLDHEELNMVALIVRLYPRSNPYDSYYYSLLPPNQKVIVSKLTSILKIADACDAAHKEKARKVTCSITDNKFVTVCESPEDMSFELWAFENRGKMFEDVMGIKPVLKARRREV
ncbi:MAG: HD domain-containing protein [Saccharofermentans sp.]|nr:HD domain-containing protein [Clostridiales bacterium]MCR5340003.1 HD domain-containing protein [Saccharofermentans sp.]